MQQSRTVLILSRYQISGEAISAFLESCRVLDRPKFQVVFRRCPSPLEMAQVEDVRPAAVLLIFPERTPVRMSGLNALFPFAKVIVLARDVSDEKQARWIGQGAGGVIDEKTAADLSVLERALDTVLDGQVWASRRVLTKCLRQPEEEPGRNGHDLTKREEELVGLLGLGLTNSSIAERLRISPKTVKGHLTNIYRKLDVDNRLQAVNKMRHQTAAAERTLVGDTT